jgi:hypothetical protein
MTITATPGDANADSYVTVQEFTDYCTARGISFPTSPAGTVEVWLRRATSYLDNQYRERWKGYRTNQTQSLAWPRIGKGGDSRFRDPDRTTFFVYGVIDADGFEIPTNVIPQQVKNATCEAALLVKSGATLEPVLERGGAIKSISKGVGPLSKSVTYMDGASTMDRYTAIEGNLRGLVKSMPGASSGNVSLVRA